MPSPLASNTLTSTSGIGDPSASSVMVPTRCPAGSSTKSIPVVVAPAVTGMGVPVVWSHPQPWQTMSS